MLENIELERKMKSDLHGANVKIDGAVNFGKGKSGISGKGTGMDSTLKNAFVEKGA